MNKKYTIFKFLFAIFISIVVIMVIIFFLKVIKNKNKHTSAAVIALQEKIEIKEKETIFFEKREEIKMIQDSVNNYFVDTEKIDTFVNYLESLGSDIGSKIIVKEIKTSDKKENLIEFQLSILGSFNQVTKTIIFLENIPYQIDITRVYYNKEIDNKEELVNPQIWRADIVFNILSLN